MKRWVVLSLALLLSPALLGCAITQQSELILDEEYFWAAHKEIQNAKSSIHLIAYLFLLYDYEDAYTNRLLDDLVEAHKRGVDVRVTLDYPSPEYMPEEGPRNQEVYDKLKEAGIDVRFDSTKKTTHNKVLIIDGKTIIIGSHNYSFAGMRYNNETSLLLRDKEKAKKLIEYFEQIE